MTTTKDGAVATCHHVVQPPRDSRAGFLIAADDFGKVFPVVEVLAASRPTDACIVRITGGDFTPLSLNTNAAPGDTVYCFSDPQGRQGYFSQGIVNRFYELPRRGPANVAERGLVRINVSAEWGPGSSGSAVLDDYGNAIGHVSTITTGDDNDPSGAIGLSRNHRHTRCAGAREADEVTRTNVPSRRSVRHSCSAGDVVYHGQTVLS